MEAAEKILIGVIVVLTALLIVVGYHVTLIIFDVRRAMKKVNEILDDAVFGGGLIKSEKIKEIIETFKKVKK